MVAGRPPTDAAETAFRGASMKLVTIATLAGLALASPAKAADLFAAPPPASFPASQAPTAIEIGSNWYLRGAIGASFPTPDQDVQIARAGLAALTRRQ